MVKTRETLLEPDLYQRDYYNWALEPAGLLRARRFAELDLEHLAEEIDGLARGEARELPSRYATLLSHLLKWEFQPERRSHSWAATIARERDAILDHLDENPGLKPRGSSCSPRPLGALERMPPRRPICPWAAFRPGARTRSIRR